MKKKVVRIKDALKKAYCTVYYYAYEYNYKDGGVVYVSENRYYTVKTNIYFPCDIEDKDMNRIKEVANDRVIETRLFTKITIGVSVNRFYEVYELPEDCDLFPNPQDFYAVDGGYIRPKIVSEKGEVKSLGLSDILCFIRKSDVEDATHLSEKEQAKFISKIEKLPPKYARGTGNTITGGRYSVWFKPWIVKKYFVEGEPIYPDVFGLNNMYNSEQIRKGGETKTVSYNKLLLISRLMYFTKMTTS